MVSKLCKFLFLGMASTFTATGSVLFAFTLAIDSWRTKDVYDKNQSLSVLSITQGILHECVNNGTRLNTCKSWKTVDDLIEFQELLFSLIISAAICGGLSLLISFVATTSLTPKFVAPVTALEFVSSLIGTTMTIFYNLIYKIEPWSLGPSYFILVVATSFMICGLVIHFFIGDVKLFGKKFCVDSPFTYRYTKTENGEMLGVI
ncbi:uncharacterized protein LOC100209184 [Hydra vulgaris]|uniref:uncharacterized protein LOC100209184 n=1 Tax=Hydra vulgaris TaxID=6087 RepID=UPI000640D113|nr:uncharacterized protein LOC100209184 [Hydra vulgaris]